MSDQRTPRGPSSAARRDRTSRRRLLAGLGSGLAAAALAGCSGTVDSEPSYEEGTVSDAGGGNRSAQEMSAAQDAAEREPSPDVTPMAALSVEDHEFVLEDDYRGPTVQGTVTNDSDGRIQLVEVRVRVFDDSGTHLGRYLATTGDLDAGSSWDFEVVLLASPSDIGSYDLAALGKQV